MECSDEKFLSNLIEVNRRAGVEPETIELLSAYAGLCLRYGKELNFSGESVRVDSKRASVKEFIRKNLHLDPRSLSFLISYAELMQERGLPFLFSAPHLAHFLDLEYEELLQLVEHKERYYRNFLIPKANGGKRTISASQDLLKAIQRKIMQGILEKVPLHPSANGFRTGKSIVTNAEKHIGRGVLIKVDLKDFFPSITAGRVKGVFLRLGYPERVADLLCELSTCRGRLPMGAPTSPALSNIVSSRMDRRFSGLSRKMGFAYSRYADDLAFSSSEQRVTRLIPFFKAIIRDEGFEPNEEKIVILRKGSRQKLTGVIVNEKVNVDGKEYRRLRAVLHNCTVGDLRAEMERFGASSLKEFKDTLQGRISFVRMLNKGKGERLLDQFGKIPWPV